MQALHWLFEDSGMLQGFCFSPVFGNADMLMGDLEGDEDEDNDEDEADIPDEAQGMSEFNIQLPNKPHAYPHVVQAHV
jgi:hypothetical protein